MAGEVNEHAGGYDDWLAIEEARGKVPAVKVRTEKVVQQVEAPLKTVNFLIRNKENWSFYPHRSKGWKKNKKSFILS